MTNEIEKFCNELEDLYEYADLGHYRDMVARVDELIARLRDYEYAQGIRTGNSPIMRMAQKFRKENQAKLNVAIEDRKQL